MTTSQQNPVPNQSSADRGATSIETMKVAPAPFVDYAAQDGRYPTKGVLDFHVDMSECEHMSFEEIAERAASIAMAVQAVLKREMTSAALSLSVRSSLLHRSGEGPADWLTHVLLGEVKRKVLARKEGTSQQPGRQSGDAFVREQLGEFQSSPLHTGTAL